MHIHKISITIFQKNVKLTQISSIVTAMTAKVTREIIIAHLRVVMVKDGTGSCLVLLKAWRIATERLPEYAHNVDVKVINHDK